jgi:hypothetical protein
MTLISASIREFVRLRAQYCCEYCHKPEGYSLYRHQIDHIIALKHEGSSEPDNLAYACFQCNTTKGSDVASYDGGILTPLFNPRIQDWNEHFEFDDALLIGKTAIGRVTIRVLQMNHPEQVETRYRLMQAGVWSL